MENLKNNKLIKFLFIKSPVLKTIIAFIITLICFFLGDRTGENIFWYISIPFFSYTAILVLIGIVVAWVNIFKDKKKKK